MGNNFVCPKGKFDEWHNRKCLFGDYFKCGACILPLCPNEIIGSNSNLMCWKFYALETTMARFDEPLKKKPPNIQNYTIC